ncbi:MAG TPA: DegT/DnrJ/EryC1/StrS family aminotransferase, partial [Bryobacteraceae bacterium]|nr:DegT/DnrJ/EryC1/StrS family aminotransferase [Bryobacteraceae bacterium]
GRLQALMSDSRIRVPMVDLRPMLAATESAWRANLERLFSRMHFILGEQVEAFEKELACELGAKHAVGVGSGTAAIELALRALPRVAGRNEVILPALTSPFCAQAVLAAGYRPKFADVDPDHLLLDPADAARRAGARTRAVLPVHLYGQPAPLTGLPRGVAIVQDACQAHGAPLRFSHPAALSFYPTKNLPCLGDGGAVLTDSRVLAERLRSLRDGGRRGGQVSRIRAVNSRLDEMQACYLRAFLPKLREWNASRCRLAVNYDTFLANCRGVRPVPRRPGSVCHLYVVRIRNREAVRRHLAAHGIATGVHYPVPLHWQPAFREFGPRRGGLPVAEHVCREILSLPLWPDLTAEEQSLVVGHLAEVV